MKGHLAAISLLLLVMWAVCPSTEGQAACITAAECDSTETCLNGTCVSLCEGVNCTAPNVCSFGSCVHPCSLCSGPNVLCIDFVCVDLCLDVVCNNTDVCNFGNCVDPCSLVWCHGRNEECMEGVCVDLCANITCGATEGCYRGNCLDICHERVTRCFGYSVCVNGSCVYPTCSEPRSCAAGACAPLYPYEMGTCLLGDSGIPLNQNKFYFYPKLFFGEIYDDYDEDDYYYYGRRITVYPDGVLSMNDDDEEFKFTTESFPFSGSGSAIIAPFMADVDLSLGGKVWLTNLYPRREEIMALIQATFPDDDIIYVNYLYAVTWENVSYFGSTDTSQTNTFQAVVLTGYHFSSDDSPVTDDPMVTEDYHFRYYSTFVIFNYGELTWTAGVNENPNGNMPGVGGDYQAQAGFNAGDGERSFSLPGSRSEVVLNLRTSSNIGIPGRWVFKVDGDEIEGFMCSNTGGSRVGLTPTSGVMLGGTLVSIIGPCFDVDNSVVTCSFGGQVVTGKVNSNLVAVCVTPVCLQRGPTAVEISVDGEIFYSTFIYMSTSATSPGVTLDNNFDNWTNCHTANMVHWNFADFPASDNNVGIDVVGYCELGSPSLVTIVPLATSVSIMSQGWEFECPNFDICPEGTDCTDIGAIRVKGVDSGVAVWSEFFPLEWICSKDPYDQCAAWISLAESVDTDDLVPCPCSLAQARNDGGRFVPVTGCGCDDERDPLNCAGRDCDVTCFRTQQSSECTGQECCYGSDGNLLSPNDDNAGFSYIAHQDGCGSSKSPETIPWLSHLLLDVFPWFHCCKCTRDSEHCEDYKTKRRSRSCDGYRPPIPAMCGGDPHILTLDGNLWTFNGWGEFQMVEVGDGLVALHARNQPISNQDATVIKAVGVCMDGADGLHVEVRTDGGLDVWVLDTTQGDQNWTFAELEINVGMPRNGYSVTKGANNYFESTNSIWVAYHSGLGLYFNGETGDEGVISIVSTGIQPSAETRGLLGTWNGDPSDDFTARDGTVYSVNSTIEQLHAFGISWEIEESESCLRYAANENHDGFTNIGYEPNFEAPENLAISEEMLEEVCGGDQSCEFDLLTTGDVGFAVLTRTIANVTFAVMAENEEVGDSCPGLTNPPNGVVTVHNALVGGNASYACNDGFLLVGNSERFCEEGPTWSGTDPVCVDPSGLTCIVKRPFVGNKEDVSVFVYGVPALVDETVNVQFSRDFDSANGVGLPPNKQRDVSFGREMELPLSMKRRGERFGIFTCSLDQGGGTSQNARAVVTSERKGLIPTDGRVTVTASVGEDVEMRVTRTSGVKRRIRWLQNRRKITTWNGRTRVTIGDVSRRDRGVYEIFQRGRRNRGLQSFIILYVRECAKDMFGTDCDQNCDCRNGGFCDELTGECTCPPGFAGHSCENAYEIAACSPDYGARGCRGLLFCLPGKFGCVCGPGWRGMDCNDECRPGTYGAGCTQRCDDRSCDPRTGQ